MNLPAQLRALAAQENHDGPLWDHLQDLAAELEVRGPVLPLLGEIADTVNQLNGWETSQPAHWPQGGAPDVSFLLAHNALFHSEVSEATEAVRHGDRDNYLEELADTVIRILSIVHGLGEDLTPHLEAKLLENTQRGFKHGGKAI